MVATFPINENTFIENIMDEVKDLDDTDNWLDIYHRYIDNQVSYNSIEENILIIDHYAGGIYDAIQLYKDNFGEFDITQSKFQFHAQLAFISIYVKFEDDIQELVDEIDNDDTDEEDKSEAEEIIE
jgi:hypothetical protein